MVGVTGRMYCGTGGGATDRRQESAGGSGCCGHADALRPLSAHRADVILTCRLSPWYNCRAGLQIHGYSTQSDRFWFDTFVKSDPSPCRMAVCEGSEPRKTKRHSPSAVSGWQPVLKTMPVSSLMFVFMSLALEGGKTGQCCLHNGFDQGTIRVLHQASVL